MTDGVGVSLEIDDIVYYRVNKDEIFDHIGIVKKADTYDPQYITVLSSNHMFLDEIFDHIGIVKKADTYDPQYITVLSSNHMFLEKLPTNVRKMSDEDAMIWKLENA
jgi:hypothetical protein